MTDDILNHNQFLSGGIWPVSDRAEISLSRWSVWETETGERHFVGYNTNDNEGRVSSAIQNFDPITRIGTTLSGRKYLLVGGAGFNTDANYVWSQWCRINKVTETKDVSNEYEENK